MFVESIFFKNKVIKFSKEKFGKIRDGAGGLIFEHNLRVAFWLENYLRKEKITIRKNEKDMIIAASIHDIIEDTDVKKEVIENLFGKKVASLVDVLTINFQNNSIEKATKKLYQYSDEALLIKMFDIYDNIKKSPYFIEKNSLEFLEKFWLPLLRQYKKIIFYKIKKIKKYKKVFRRIFTDLIKEIDFYLEYYSLIKKINNV